MKRSIYMLLLTAALVLPMAFTACAGTEKMQDKQMQSAKMMNDKAASIEMQDAKRMDTGMKDTGRSDDKMMKDKMKDDPMAGPMVAMLSGSDGHHAAGKAALSEEMGKYVLTLSDIKVDKVPDGQVYLAKNGDRKQGIHLGMLKQFTGTVNFALPAGADPGMYDSVIIYCEKFNVEIGRAVFPKKM